MGLIGKLFGGDNKASVASSRFAESQHSESAQDSARSQNGVRRDLVKMALRSTMRKHGIPSDWIECRALSVLTRRHNAGMHVHFLVRKADHQLLPHVHAFQESFWHEIGRTDPQVRDWLFSVGWEFHGKAIHDFSAMGEAPEWQDTGGDDSREDERQVGAAGSDEELATDLQALQALMTAPAELRDLPQAAPRKHRSPA